MKTAMSTLFDKCQLTFEVVCSEIVQYSLNKTTHRSKQFKAMSICIYICILKASRTWIGGWGEAGGPSQREKGRHPTAKGERERARTPIWGPDLTRQSVCACATNETKRFPGLTPQTSICVHVHVSIYGLPPWPPTSSDPRLRASES